MHTFLTFLNQSYTAFHAIQNIEHILQEAGFISLNSSKTWSIEKGKKYYFIKNSSSIVAFQIPTELKNVGFHIVTSHSDSPSYKIKPNATMVDNQNGYVRLNTEGYGAMINYSWMDRPLGIAGRIFVEDGNKIVEKLIRFDETITIPSLAIHLNRSEEWKPNPQIDMLPLFGNHAKFEDRLKTYANGNVIAHDLFLYNKEEARVIGIDREYIASGRLDDLECVYASIQALIQSTAKNINICAIFNNEEVGSRSNNGADSTLLEEVMEGICRSLSIPMHQVLARSFLVSADNAHAVHPNHPEKTDPTNRVYMNKGIVIKHQAGLSYTTDALSEAIFKKICIMADVPYQDYTNRSDERGGSTLGAIVLSHVSIPSVDIGLAQLAMHSSMELAGTEDLNTMIQVLVKYFETRINYENNTIMIQ